MVLFFSECKVSWCFLEDSWWSLNQKKENNNIHPHLPRIPWFFRCFFHPRWNPWEVRLSWSKPLGPKRPLGANIKASDTSSQPVPSAIVPKSRMVGALPFSGGSLKMESLSMGWDCEKMMCTFKLEIFSSSCLCSLSNPCFCFRGSSTRIRMPPENNPTNYGKDAPHQWYPSSSNNTVHLRPSTSSTMTFNQWLVGGYNLWITHFHFTSVIFAINSWLHGDS